MRKIAPLIAIITGIITISFSIISLLAVRGIIGNNSWVGKFPYGSTASTVGLIIAIIVGIIEILLGNWSWQKARGIASLLLIIFFGLSIANLIYIATTGNGWPISTIIALVINGIAFAGITAGFIKGK